MNPSINRRNQEERKEENEHIMELSLQNHTFIFPNDYHKLVHHPEDPADAIMLQKETAQAEILIKLRPVSGEQLMPFDDPQMIVDTIHASVTDRQGLVEVDAGYTTSGNDFVYSIVKCRQSTTGIEYILTLQILTDSAAGAALEIQGWFREIGSTGARDSLVHDQWAAEEDAGSWFEDPYNPDFKQGLLMNQSEAEAFDDFFPLHPLSEARRLINTLADTN